MVERERGGIVGSQPGKGAASSGSRSAPPQTGRMPRALAAPVSHRFTISELVNETEASARTIRYYITEGLLPPAYGRGPNATYDRGHLLRLRLIGDLKQRRLGLNEIKRRLQELSDEDVAALLVIQTRPVEDRWRRVALHPDIELHVRESAGALVDVAFESATDEIIGLCRVVVERLEREG